MTTAVEMDATVVGGALREAGLPRQSLTKQEREARRLMAAVADNIVEATSATQARNRLERVLMQDALVDQLRTLDALVGVALDPEALDFDAEVQTSVRDTLGARAVERLRDGVQAARRLAKIAILARTAPLATADAGDEGPTSTSGYPRHLWAVADHPAIGAVVASQWRGMIAMCAIIAASWTERTLPQDVAWFLADTFATGMRDWCRVLAACVRPEALTEEILATPDRLNVGALIAEYDAKWAEIEARSAGG